MSLPAITTTTIILTALAFVLARKGPTWKLHWQFARAFRAGRRFYRSSSRIAKDIRYGDQPRRTLDVYWPPVGDRLPVLLFAYGGSWSWGDKSLYPLVGQRFSAHGFVVVVINYSLYPDAVFPAFVEDAAAAVAWTIQNIDTFHGDPARLFVAGHSAGGHILSLIALDDRYLAAHGLTRDVLRGVIAISAPTDLGALTRHLQIHPSIASAAGLQAIMGGAERMPQADPSRHVRADAPPILLIHGVRDNLVPITIARDFASALKTAGAQAELLEYDRADHYSLLLDGVRENPDRPLRLLVDSVRFMRAIDAVSHSQSLIHHAAPQLG
jgi:acetyl esterase/lipase